MDYICWVLLDINDIIALWVFLDINCHIMSTLLECIDFIYSPWLVPYKSNIGLSSYEWYIYKRCVLFLCCYIFIFLLTQWMGCLCGIVANILDCDIGINEFKLQSPYYIHFQGNTLGERYKPYSPSSYKLNCTTIVFFTRMALVLDNALKVDIAIKQRNWNWLF